MYWNSTGTANSGFGSDALSGNITGSGNTAVGGEANVNGTDYNYSSAFGWSAIITASNQVRIGDENVTSIGGYTNWTNISDKRVKKNIKTNVPGLAFINKLQPITYNLDLNVADKIIQRSSIKDKEGKAIQPTKDESISRKAKEQIVYTGFVAQDVEKAAKELNYDFSGVDAAKNDKDLYGLRYADFVVPLVKAVQELSKMNDEKDAKINELETRLSKLESTMNVQQTAISSASLEQNIPNPFNLTTTINYTLPQQYSAAKIVIVDQTGKVLKEVNISGSGKGSINVDASILASGAYHYSLIVNGKIIESKQMVLTR
jgi:hypothetical protein